jgi:heterodisulfide reductase subunit A
VKKIGVFLCHCGLNIAGTVDVERVAEEMREYPGVVYVEDQKYMCSDPGQNALKGAIGDHLLDGVVIAACSPSMHETTFRNAVASQGLNPYQCEIANIREHCSWVHREVQAEATAKAAEITKTMVQKVRSNQSLELLSLPLVKRAMVVGAGIAGLQAALDIADAGHPVILVEKEARLGGHVAQLSGIYLNLEAASDALTAMIRRAEEHPLVQVLTRAQVQEASGHVGSFTVKVNQEDDEAEDKPESAASGRAGTQLRTFTFDVGAMILATGYELYPKEELGEYGGDKHADVINAVQFEQLLAANGPTGGQIRRPSDGMVPEEVVFVQCAGSRDPELHKPYCSKICCMYVAKQAMMYKRQVPQGQAYVFYIDIRSQGKGYEEFVQSAIDDYDVLYLRGKVSRIFEEDSKVMVWGVDTLSGVPVQVTADLVVLATASVPSAGAKDLAQRLRVSLDEDGFFREAHPKLRPVETLTPGIYLAGASQFPKDIPETISHASGAAAKVLQLFSQNQIAQEPTIACVDEEVCSGCGLCVSACPYEAMSLHPRLSIAVVSPALCRGCGACVAVCPSKACGVHNSDTAQLLAMVDALL